MCSSFNTVEGSRPKPTDAGYDETLWFNISGGEGRYTASREKERGPFKYMTLVRNSTVSVEVIAAEVHYTPMPHWEDDAIGDYTGYFHCDVRWLMDGAKRDRLVWAGDMAIAVPSIVVSTNDFISVENSLNSLFDIQNMTTGQLPYVGGPFPSIPSPFCQWDQDENMTNIDFSGLMNVTSPNDWLRFGMGGHNIEVNAVLYYKINQAISLANALNDTTNLSSWHGTAERIKTAANEQLWSETAGIQVSRISSQLVLRWTPYGAPAVEAADAISPFISGFELQAHFLAANTSAALALMRPEWGFMLDNPRMTNPTLIEGYSTTGELHYALYRNVARISHAHDWATGHTSSLTMYVAGIQLVSAGGATWRIAPSLGDLKFADAGFRTSLGFFGARTTIGDESVEVQFEAPEGTTG
ncbi:Six-hairpin glycosidase [Clathrospora elynae]|uniref:Six-hairpin glycosidase n=1 Tax=Clathrospora elynae TaxID=706981 RepID=A0A6A5SK04_9PLEO|nr:Six-hairpin glycosidase [Clathrospora elynae]